MAGEVGTVIVVAGGEGGRREDEEEGVVVVVIGLFTIGNTIVGCCSLISI